MVDVQEDVTVAEAARLLGVPRRRIWELLRDGMLTSYPNPLDRREKRIPRIELLRLQRTPTQDNPLLRHAGIVAVDWSAEDLEDELSFDLHPDAHDR